jgi:predicted TIM-barrel fold metal-dependent hydrolase
MKLSEIKPHPLGDVPGSPENIKLKDYRPESIFNSARTMISQARYAAIDMHAHAMHTNISGWAERMDAANVEKSIILSFETGAGFDEIISRYAPYGNRFSIWCGFDYTGYDEPGNQWIDHALAELKRCHSMGARGVGELGDKGLGEFYSRPVPGYGLHLDDIRMDPLFEACGKLGLPVNVHIADPIWMYLPMDIHNDGMMNAYNWRIDVSQEGMLGHAQMINMLEHTVQKHPGTIFIACHLANCCHNLQLVGKLLDRYPNLYADISSRLKELATVPRYARDFFIKYQDRLFFGSDIGYDPAHTLDFATEVYQASFRLLESADDHIYEHHLFKYHWPLYGLELPEGVLKKLYRDNALKLLDN